MATGEDLRTQIIAAVSGTSTRIFIGSVRKPGDGIPDKAIFIGGTGGFAPNEFMGSGTFGTYKKETWQVRVRGDRNDFSTGQTLAQNVWNSLQAPNLTGYVRVVNLQSAPQFMGLDDTEHPEWVFNVLVEKKE